MLSAMAPAGGCSPESAGTVRHDWITLRDGERLAVTVYLPAATDAGEQAGGRVPCLLEALPYRKDDLTAGYRPEYVRFRDEHGYAVARVDLRGTGSSTGVALDEYHPTEQADLHEVIGWLAGRPWCTGAIGMFGTSWSGFNSLQLALERPPALRAIVASYATDDRWTDDVHYMGGALRLLDQIDYPLYMVAMNALPPVPALSGDGWREEWLRRVEQAPPWLITWIEQQTDGPYWRHGSVRAAPGSPPEAPSYQRIGCPTLLIAGWADGYRNNTFRTFAALSQAGTPVAVVAGPWCHPRPATTGPGPRIDHVPVMARWWDRWLRDVRNGVDDEPPVTAFVRRYAPPEPDADSWPGGWQAHDTASLAARTELALPLAEAPVLRGGVRTGDVVGYAGNRDVGVTAWNSCAGALPWGQPEDQTPDDVRSLCLEWTLPAGTVLLGHPRLRLRVRPDGEVAFVSAKLSLVGPAGRPSLLVDRGLLNLAYAGGDSTRPRPCVPGEWLDVELELEACAVELTDADGGPVTLRLALACADWPNTVAPPATWSAIDLAASTLLLPISAGTPHPAPVLPDPPAPLPPAPDPDDSGEDGEHDSHVAWRVGRDVLGRSTQAAVEHGSSYPGNFGARCVEDYQGRLEIDQRTAVQRVSAAARFAVAWPDDDAAPAVDSEARLALTADDEAFDVRVELEVSADGEPFTRRSWHRRIPRTLG
jgi:putative CocE/NonD family hydrolase